MKKKTGSILIYVMMIFTVLMIMGATLSMLTMQNIKNRKHYSKSRINLYYSESGIDVTYGILKEYVKKAAEYSTKNTNTEIQIKIDNELEKFKNFEGAGEIVIKRVEVVGDIIKLYDKNDVWIEDVEILNDGEINEKVMLYNEIGELNEEVMEAVQDLLFEKHYLSYFNMVKGSEQNFMHMINDAEALSNSSGVESQIEVKEVKVLNKSKYENVNAKIDGPFTLSLQSTFIKDNIEKIIKADFEFEIPAYASKLSFPVKYTNVSMTPVMNKGLVVNEKMNLDGALKVEGDVYVKGKNNKGIIMNSDTSKLHVQGGSVTACEGVDYDYDYDYEIETNMDGTHKGAKINIESGNLYTRNISFKGKKKSSGDSKGAQGSKLIVGGGVYVHDDLQIDSDYTTVKVGDYFGVSDGRISEENKVDNSSSIIINTENVGQDGTKVIIDRKVIIAGNSYIRHLKNPGLSEDYSYQTGESISVKGNYVAYSYPLKDSYNIETDNLGEKDIKYELERTHLSPLTLVTHYDIYPKWFAVYGSGEDRKILVSFNDDYKEKFKEAKYFKIKDTSKVIPLHVKYNVYENLEERKIFFDEMDAKEELEIILLDENGVEITEIKVKKIEKDLEAFLFAKKTEEKTEKWIYTEITPKGTYEDFLLNAYNYSTSSSENEKGEFSKFLKVNSTVEKNNTITIKCYDRAGVEIKQYDLVVKDYNKIAVDSKEKSEIFKEFYEDYGSEKIKGANGIFIGNKNGNIYSGAILLNGGVSNQNYYLDPLGNDLIIRHREDVLKDKRYYMDVFEKQYDGEQDNPYIEKEIENFNDEEAKSTYADIDSAGKTPSDTKDYVLTPSRFIKLDKDSDDNIYKLNELGLYVNYSDNDVLLTDMTDQTFSGDKLVIRNNDYGVIVCKGDLYMRGDFTFTGTIIVMGNVFIEEGANITIKYDESVVADIIASESEITKDIFKEDTIYKCDKVSVVFYQETSKDNTSIPLRINKWVVVK